MRERTSRFSNLPKLAGMSPEKLFPDKSREVKEGRSARVWGISPVKRHWERSRVSRLLQAPMSRGSSELMELLEKERCDRLERRQMTEGKGPARLALERSTEVTEEEEEFLLSQETPCHRQGEASWEFHVEREESGSSRESLTCWRMKPSWFREKTEGKRRKRKRRCIFKRPVSTTAMREKKIAERESEMRLEECVEG